MHYKPALTSFFSLFFAGWVLAFLFPSPATAVFFQESFIRLDRLRADSPLSGVVCVRPSSAAAGVETQLDITFPSGFSLSSVSSDWTVSADDLPTGTVYWPGIGSASPVISAQTLTLPSADLSADSLYCFRFSGSGSTVGPVGSVYGSLVTRAVGGGEINSREYNLQIIADDQLTVTGRIGARSSDLANTLSLSIPGTTHAQNVTWIYDLNYGTYLDYSTDLLLEVSWGLGTIQGDSIPTIDLLEYYDNSATMAYGNTPAVVDLAAKTITWSISDFPANTRGHVQFKFWTNSDYQGSLPAKFTFSTRVANSEATAVPSSLNCYYQFDSSLVTYPPDPYARTVVPTPTPVPGVSLSGLQIRSVSTNQATFSVLTSAPAKITVKYGQNTRQLNSAVTSVDYSSRHQITLDNLAPDTPYYFIITGQTSSGKSFSSGIYTFKTASSRQPLSFDPASFFALSSGKLIFDPTFLSSADSLPFLVVPKNLDYEIKFALADQTPIDSARVLVENKRVLGWASVAYAAGPGLESGEVLETALNTFTTRLTTPEQIGDYEIFVQTTDVYGNQTLTKLADLYVTDYLTVVDADTGRGIESAQVNFYLYDSGTRLYRFISPTVFSIRNPDYTDKDGRLKIALPPLSYRIEINAIGYKPAKIDFILSAGNSHFPAVKLNPEPFVLKTVVVYYATIIADSLEITRIYVRSLTDSLRFFQLSALVTICFFILLNYLALRARTNIPLQSLFEHFWHHTGAALKSTPKHDRIIGRVLDKDSGRPLAKTGVFIIDNRDRVVAHAFTDTDGYFSVVKLFPGEFHLEALKEGFASARFVPTDASIYYLTHVGRQVSVMSRLKSFFWGTASLLLEVLLLASLFFELTFGFLFSWWQVLPFLLLSLANLALWLTYRVHTKV